MQQCGSLYLQKEKKGGFALLSISQVRSLNKCKGRSEPRILSVVCIFSFFFALPFSFWNRLTVSYSAEQFSGSQLVLKSALCPAREKLYEGKSRDCEANEFFRLIWSLAWYIHIWVSDCFLHNKDHHRKLFLRFKWEGEETLKHLTYRQKKEKQ